MIRGGASRRGETRRRDSAAAVVGDGGGGGGGEGERGDLHTADTTSPAAVPLALSTSRHRGTHFLPHYKWRNEHPGTPLPILTTSLSERKFNESVWKVEH